MKKVSLGILSMALVAGLGLVSCNKGDNNTSKDMGSVIKTKEDVYAYSMFSSSTLLDNLSVPSVRSLAASSEAEKQAEIEKVDNYVKMFEGLLTSKGIDQKTEKNTDEEYKEYETKMTVVQSGKTYVSYMNETAKNEEDKDKEDDEEVEIETLIDGIMFELDADSKPVASYIIDGSKEIEKEVEDGETEEELEIKMTSYLAEKNAEGKYEKVDGAKSVTVKQEFETETKEDGTVEKEQSFKYTVKDGKGNIINDECSKIEIEEEKGEIEISLQLGNNEDNAKIYEFTKKGEDELEVEVYEGEDNKVETIKIKFVKNEDGSVTHEYTFEDGSKLEEKEDD